MVGKGCLGCEGWDRVRWGYKGEAEVGVEWRKNGVVKKWGAQAEVVDRCAVAQSQASVSGKFRVGCLGI